MTTFKSLWTAIALILVSGLAAAPALAQKVIVVNQERVLVESAAGIDMATKLTGIADQMSRELEPNATQLQTLGDTLSARTANMSVEAQRADAGIMAQRQDYTEKLNALGREDQRRQVELAQTQERALIAFGTALKPVLEQVMAERGAEVLLSENEGVILATGAADVTDLVISKMNSSAPTIQVVRVRLPDQPQQQ
ncbi:MAG: OmpH family outer membrane protein [Pseudomonadota bacterium]